MNQVRSMEDHSIKFDPGSTDLLLHACCGPCAEWPVRQLRQEGKRLLIWYYNPNIQPLAENRRRLDNLQRLTHMLDLPCLAEPGCEPETWLNWADPAESRCRMCYRRRLNAAAVKARELGIPAFSTTLLVSPWQDHAALREIGGQAALAAGVDFIYRDFRDGYKQGQAMAKEDGLYRQRYCGCLPSLAESSYCEKIKRDLEALSAQSSESGNDHI